MNCVMSFAPYIVRWRKLPRYKEDILCHTDHGDVMMHLAAALAGQLHQCHMAKVFTTRQCITAFIAFSRVDGFGDSYSNLHVARAGSY